MVYQFDDYRRDKGGEVSEQFSLPQSVEAEQSVLGGLLFDMTAMDRVAEILKPQMFYLVAHQQIYKTIADLYAEEQPIDLLSVAQRLADTGLIEKVGGNGKLAELFESSVGAVNVDFHAQLIADKYKRRCLIQSLQGLLRSAYGSAAWSELIEEAESKIFGLSDAAKEGGLRPASEFLVEEIERVEKVLRGEGGQTGVATGFYDFDAMTRGLKPHQLVIVAGRPGMAKTSFAAAVARNIAGDGHSVALFSLEMSGGEIMRRLLSAESGIESSRLETAQLFGGEWETAGHAFPALSALPLYLDESQDVTPSSVLSRCRLLKSRVGSLGAIVIDYLHLMLDGSDDEVRELGRITRACKKIARSLNTPVILLSQLNRAVESKAEKRPSLSDLRGSGSIEQDADLVVMLYREEYYNPDTTDRGIAEIIIAKQRNGPTGTIKLLFEPQFTRFRNLARPGGATTPPPQPKAVVVSDEDEELEDF